MLIAINGVKLYAHSYTCFVFIAIHGVKLYLYCYT